MTEQKGRTGLVRAAVGLILLLSIASLDCDRRRTPCKYCVPEGYVGWLRIDFEVKGAPAVQVEDGYSLFRFPANGLVKTCSKVEAGLATDLYYYYSKSGIRTLTVNENKGAGGMVWGQFVGGQWDKTNATYLSYQYLFVGPEEAFLNASAKAKDDSSPPPVGPISE